MNEYEIMKFHNGKKISFVISHDGGMHKIKCEVCGRGFTTIHIKETLGIVDNLVVVDK